LKRTKDWLEKDRRLNPHHAWFDMLKGVYFFEWLTGFLIIAVVVGLFSKPEVKVQEVEVQEVEVYDSGPLWR